MANQGNQMDQKNRSGGGNQQQGGAGNRQDQPGRNADAGMQDTRE